MIPRTQLTVQGSGWQEELAHLITDPLALLRHLGLEDVLGQQIPKAGHFPLRVTPSFVSRIRHGDPNDPLLRQILPLGLEYPAQGDPTWHADPLQEQAFIKAPGLIHKYHGRILLIAAPQCAIHCRYCFRRHFDYSDHSPGRQAWQPAFDYIRTNSSIKEVILSGGDPLILADRQLEWFIQQLETVAHVDYLRIHSRMPVVLPKRMTSRLKALLSSTRLKSVLVVHCNHPNEIDEEFARAAAGFKQAGITLLNQSVLLKDINDSVKTLEELSHKLFRYGVIPYYVHFLDKVAGARHFAVKRDTAQELMRQLRAHLPGYLVPGLVQEIPGAASKVPLL